MGLETARALGEYGPVFVGGRNQERLQQALSSLKGSGIDAYGSPCDIADVASVKAFAEAATAIAPIGNVVNAAGVDFDFATNEQMVAINMVGTVNVVETFLPLMAEGTMLNYSSITGYYYRPVPEEIAVWDAPTAPDFASDSLSFIAKAPHPAPGRLPDTFPCYTATKKFVMHYTMANASRFGAKGLRVLSVAPGSFDTPMLAAQKDFLDTIAAGTAFKRVGRPEEMAILIRNLLDPKVTYLTGCDIIMDGGKFALDAVKQL